ncbi:MAG: hypothetical protein ACRCZF_18520, partial [Gemmataceae bacterium]
MGRMFRIITEGNLDYPTVTTATVTESEPYVQGSAPFIEVGGPNGPITTIPKPIRKAEPMVIKSAPAVMPIPVPTRPMVDDRFLSVALHQIAPKAPPTIPVVTPSTISADVVAYHHPDHAVSSEYRNLRDDLRKQAGPEIAPRAVLFSSAASDNGTTTVLLNLAVTLAKEAGTRVLVIDADLDRPGAAKKMGLSDIPGLAEVLAQNLPLAWALQPTAVPKLQLLGTGKATEATLAALATEFPRMVTQLRQWFDWILIDGGVWGERPLRDSTSPAYDSIYLVTRQSELDRPNFHSLRGQVARYGG